MDWGDLGDESGVQVTPSLFMEKALEAIKNFCERIFCTHEYTMPITNIRICRDCGRIKYL